MSKDNDTPSRTVNLVYTDGIIPVPFSSLSKTYRGAPAQLLENKGFPLKSISSFSLAPGTQKITDVGISFDIPWELYGHIVSPSQVSWFEPLVAFGFLLPLGSHAIHLLIPNPYGHQIDVRKNQVIAYLHFQPLLDINSLIPFGDFGDIELPTKTAKILSVISREDLIDLDDRQFEIASELLNKYKHIFAKDDYDLGCASNTQHV